MIHNPNREGKHAQYVQRREIFAFKTWICIRRQHIQDTYFKSETVYFDKPIARNATMCSPMPPSMEFVLWLNTQHPSLERDLAKATFKAMDWEESHNAGRWKQEIPGEPRGNPIHSILTFSLFCLCFFYYFFFYCLLLLNVTSLWNQRISLLEKKHHLWN